jgi:hypothetical protein
VFDVHCLDSTDYVRVSRQFCETVAATAVDPLTCNAALQVTRQKM